MLIHAVHASLQTMPIRYPVPPDLLDRPFTYQQALDAGLTDRVVRGPRFQRLFQGIYVSASHEMTHHDWLRAAQLAAPEHAHLSHVSRIQAAGLDVGERRPVHFTTAIDSSAKRDGIFVHRTDELPPLDDVGVTPAAALIGYAAMATALDVIVAADWLLHRELTSIEEIHAHTVHDPWRPGADAVTRLLSEFDGRAASPPESKCRLFLVFAGLPRPDVNVPVLDDPNSPISDLLIRAWRTAIEYEGLQHFTDPSQMKRDIERYAAMRSAGVSYVQAYDHKLRSPKAFVLEVDAALRSQGFVGPRPDFGTRWKSLFALPSRTGWKSRRRPRRPQ